MLYTLAEMSKTGSSLRSIFLTTWTLTYVLPGGHFEFIRPWPCNKKKFKLHFILRNGTIKLNFEVSIKECKYFEFH